jgi:hypothetical protein
MNELPLAAAWVQHRVPLSDRQSNPTRMALAQLLSDAA